MKKKLDRAKLPRHVAFIMDGNGRWAKRRLLPREFGHREGVKALIKAVEYSIELGIEYLTFYAFSTENWKRPRKEVDSLLAIFRDYLSDVSEDFYERGIRVVVLGDLTAFPADLQEACRKIVERTADRSTITVNIALNYGGRAELVRAVHRMNQAQLTPSEENISACLDTAGQPDPDLLIRPGGEKRLSNFLLWQCAYAELYFSDTAWPDFGRREFTRVLSDYAKRNRRFGAVET